jgi:hypothetical protein
MRYALFRVRLVRGVQLFIALRSVAVGKQGQGSVSNNTRGVVGSVVARCVPWAHVTGTAGHASRGGAA